MFIRKFIKKTKIDLNFKQRVTTENVFEKKREFNGKNKKVEFKMDLHKSF